MEGLELQGEQHYPLTHTNLLKLPEDDMHWQRYFHKFFLLGDFFFVCNVVKTLRIKALISIGTDGTPDSNDIFMAPPPRGEGSL